MYSHTKASSSWRNVALAMLAGLLLIGLAVSPASADQPTELTRSRTFSDIDPCTGLEHEITLNLEVWEHQQHNGNFVAHVKRTGSTDSGYVLNNGVENFQFNGNVARGTFSDIWRNEDGSKMKVKGVFVDNLNTGELSVDRFSLSCIGN